jgi:3-oxoacyl-(acyl-carrier-protein) synthase
MKPSISAIKSYFGHTFAAAGSIETIVGLLSMKHVIFSII